MKNSFFLLFLLLLANVVGFVTSLVVYKPEILLGIKAEEILMKCETDWPRKKSCVLKAEPSND